MANPPMKNVGNSLTPDCPVCSKPMQMMRGEVCSPTLKPYAKDMFYVCTTHDMRVRCYPETLRAMGRPADGTLREERAWIEERMNTLIDGKVRRDKVSRDEAKTAAWKWMSKICGRKLKDAEEMNIPDVTLGIPALRPKEGR